MLPPRLGRLLVEPMADKEEQFGQLVDHVIDEVGQRKEQVQVAMASGDPDRTPQSREIPSRPQNGLIPREEPVPSITNSHVKRPFIWATVPHSRGAKCPRHA